VIRLLLGQHTCQGNSVQGNSVAPSKPPKGGKFDFERGSSQLVEGPRAPGTDKSGAYSRLAAAPPWGCASPQGIGAARLCQVLRRWLNTPNCPGFSCDGCSL
jgi:hypothetical protein